MSKFSFLISLLQTNHHNDSGSDECSPYSTNYFQRTHFSKAHLEKLQLDAGLPLPAPYKLFNNQKN